MSTILHTWCGLSARTHAWNVLHAARRKYRTQNSRKKSPSAHHHTSLLGYIFATKACIDNRKNVKQQYFLHMSSLGMVNIGPLTAEIGWPVWGTPAHFNGFRVLASLVHWHRSTEVNQTLHDMWPSPGWYIIYTLLWPLDPFRNSAGAKFTLRPSLAFSYILASLLRGTRAVNVSQTLRSVWYKEWN